MPHSMIGDHVERLIAASLGSAWTRLYDSVSIPTYLARYVLNQLLVSILFTRDFIITFDGGSSTLVKEFYAYDMT